MFHPSRQDPAQTDSRSRIITYAHPAEDAEGKRLPESSRKWQPLRTHLENVATLAAKFAAPFGASAEARLANGNHFARTSPSLNQPFQ
ncbi:MAG: hypothetical protein RL077_4691 [Verrucomicrobiota bacterium]|jgi:hypothetical protein